MWERWRSEDGTGAQQEMDGSTVGSMEPVEICRGGKGQGRDRDEGYGRAKDVEV